ncbi:hypothetical protein Bca52824_025554 [Brassica carinata]|uniref:Mic1 domain-containing protein n=1 Tax=Brassica carinata TaxID=52824 RepID=A0A8X7V9E9_BRACI|nr:hypothetical protein Bca52824_025554 [Brassica carinata]
MSFSADKKMLSPHSVIFQPLINSFQQTVVIDNRTIKGSSAATSPKNLRVRKLGLDMLRQLPLHHDYIPSLVRDGYYLEALRYAQKHKVKIVATSLFLEATFASNDMQHLAAMLRVLSELIPGFKETTEYYIFYGLLNETSSSVAICD